MPSQAIEQSRLCPKDFSEFFRRVNDKPDNDEPADPFRWQERMVREAIDRGLPNTVSLPTAAGKTSMLDIALFALAAVRSGANRWSDARPLPRRLFFSVDRRLIVDQTARHAHQLLERLHTDDSPVVRRVRYWLAEGRESPFVLFNWRGGLHLPATWETDPMAVVVCVATVDQVGSRLLFRGYGSSAKHRPVFAAMIGLDSAIILDEAHLSAPFLQTARAVEIWQRTIGTGEGIPIPPLQVVQLGATLEAKPDFELREDKRYPERDEWEDPGLRSRLHAHKMLRIEKSEKPLVDRIVRDVRSAIGKVKRIGVVVSSVRLARSVFDRLSQSPPRAKGCVDRVCVFLLTGRNRPFVRDQIAKEVDATLRSASHVRPTIVVATQCVEAGYDVSFDRLISDFPVISSLIQRLGRLNRYGEFERAEAIVHYRPGEKSVYGDALAEHWRWAETRLFRAQGMDVSPFALAELCKKFPPPAVDAPHTPVLLGPHLDVLALTNPLPGADLDIESLLHGQDHGAPDVQIAWRADLTEENREAWPNIVAAVPPRTAEAISVPKYEVVRWLAALASGEKPEPPALSDTDRNPHEDVEQRSPRLARAVVYQWQGRDEDPICSVPENANEILPGAFVVVPAAYRGCDRFGWAPDSREPVDDIGDLPPGFWHRRIRLHPCVHSSISEDDARRIHEALTLEGEGVELALPPMELALQLCAGLPSDLTQGDLSPETSAAILALDPHPSGVGAILHIRRQSPWRKDRFFEILLDPHQRAVAKRLIRWLKGFSSEFRKGMLFAALHHDDGKADPRQQIDFHGGDAVEANAWIRQGRFLAKPRVRPPANRRLPRGCRHELASVAIADELLRSRQLMQRELALSVIGSHHGRGRALIIPHEDPRPVQVERHGVQVASLHPWLIVGSGWLDIFARLNRRLGPYRLAYLQSLLILADERQSADEQEEEE